MRAVLSGAGHGSEAAAVRSLGQAGRKENSVRYWYRSTVRHIYKPHTNYISSLFTQHAHQSTIASRRIMARIRITLWARPISYPRQTYAIC